MTDLSSSSTPNDNTESWIAHKAVYDVKLLWPFQTLRCGGYIINFENFVKNFLKNFVNLKSEKFTLWSGRFDWGGHLTLVSKYALVYIYRERSAIPLHVWVKLIFFTIGLYICIYIYRTSRYTCIVLYLAINLIWCTGIVGCCAC